MPNIQGAPLEEQVKILLEQNLAYSKEIYHISKKVKSYILWGRVMSSISIVVFIIVPIILGIFYWQPIVNSIMGKFLPACSSRQVQRVCWAAPVWTNSS